MSKPYRMQPNFDKPIRITDLRNCLSEAFDYASSEGIIIVKRRRQYFVLALAVKGKLTAGVGLPN